MKTTIGLSSAPVSSAGLLCVALLGCSNSATPGSYTPYDGGSDVVASDAAVRDAIPDVFGPSDSVADVADPSDGFGESASNPDTDARPSDAGIFDARPSDAGSFDVGTFDARPFDAGALDHVPSIVVDDLLGGGVTFTPPVLSPDIEIGNPGRGFHQWNTTPLPSGVPQFESYVRFAWRDLEPSKDRYDFSLIEEQLAKLKAGQRFAFRVMALNTCCTAFKTGGDVPEYVVHENLGWSIPFRGLKGSESIFVPDWNDPELLVRMEKLIKAIADKYDGNPRIAWVETSLYGNWAEWHTYPLQYPNAAGQYQAPPPSATYIYAPIVKDPNDPGQQKYRVGALESKQRILRAHTSSFKKTRLVQSTSDLPILFEALRQNLGKTVGIRRDSWGDQYFLDITKWNSYQPTAEERLIFNESWKNRPFYTENWGGSFAGEEEMLAQIEGFHVSAIAFGNLGEWPRLPAVQQQAYLRCARRTGYRYQVTSAAMRATASRLELSTSWKNVNIAPSFESWTIQAYLVDPATGTLYSNVAPVPVSLQTLYSDTAPVMGAAVGLELEPNWMDQTSLDLRIVVKDSDGYLLPMNLDLQGKNPDGSYTLLSVTK